MEAFLLTFLDCASLKATLNILHIGEAMFKQVKSSRGKRSYPVPSALPENKIDGRQFIGQLG